MNYNRAAAVLSLCSIAVLSACNSAETLPNGEALQPERKTMTIADLFELDDDMVCSFSNEEEGSLTNGTIFIQADTGNMRAQFIQIKNGIPEESTIVRTEEKTYFWTNKMQQGAVMETDKNTLFGQGGMEGDASMIVEEDKKLPFACEPWKSVPEAFVPPSSIKFVNMSQIRNAIMNGGSPDAMNRCAACDLAPDEEAKAECKAALGC